MTSGSIPVQALDAESHRNEQTHFKIELLLPKEREEPSEFHRHEYCEFLIFREGGGHHMIDFVNYQIQPRSIHWVAPGQVHQVFRQRNVTGYVLLFSKEFLYVSQEAVLDNILPVHLSKDSLTEGVFDDLEKLILQIKVECDASSNYHQDIIRYFLKILLLKLQRIEKAEFNNSDPIASLVIHFEQILEKHYKNWHQVQQYANALCVSEKKLNQILKSKLGKTCSLCIQERLLLEAKRLLVYSGLSNKEIAFELKFDDPSHFSKFFRKHCQLSPSEFKKQFS